MVKITPAVINAARKIHFGSEHEEIVEFIKFAAVTFGGPRDREGAPGDVTRSELFFMPEDEEDMPCNIVRQAFSREDAPPVAAEAMAQLRSKLWTQLLQEESDIINDHGEVIFGGKSWRFQTVLANVDPSSSPEYQESIVCGEVTATPFLKKEVAAIVLQDASERIAASLRYKQDIQGDLPSLPDGLWLMDTGCGVDLINWA